MKFDFNKHDLIKLFLVCAFPIHLWWIYMIFRDVGWITERTTASDALGFSAYALVYALIESIFIYLLILAASFLLPLAWEKAKRINILGVFVFGATFWFIVEQAALIYGPSRLQSFFNTFLLFSNPLAALNAVTALTVLASFSIPVFLIARYGIVNRAITSIVERLILLSGLYIILDITSIIIILIRNFNS